MHERVAAGSNLYIPFAVCSSNLSAPGQGYQETDPIWGRTIIMHHQGHESVTCLIPRARYIRPHEGGGDLLELGDCQRKNERKKQLKKQALC